MANRNFIVFYSGSKDGKAVVGSAVVTTKDGAHMNNVRTVQHIVETRQLDGCGITGFNEVSDADIVAWTAN